ncbi:MAG: SAM-dependent methyltransferase [Cellvibrionales bacterium TMED122]|nr:MAG: SAM-dependent methyltransferase [Cellvibrionales bacterium TMED122]|tara:strand:- start:1654 stop:2319 length:666 start_codon:yes stop_codon:yes gene_type:complete
MGKKLFLVTKLHKSTKRNYLQRMVNQKVLCMKKARKFEFDYWDGKRKYGYGGYKYIPGRWSGVAKKLIKKYKLNNKSKILDVGCGKGYVLYEIKKILPEVGIYGFDVSKHALKNSKKEVKDALFIHDARKKYPFKNNFFDLAISLACLHNLKIHELEKSIKEIQRVSKKAYIMVEGYRNDKELFNLQCWALTAETFFDDKEWIWLFKKCGYQGDYEFIYFE